jgi:hypothetical protein
MRRSDRAQSDAAPDRLIPLTEPPAAPLVGNQCADPPCVDSLDHVTAGSRSRPHARQLSLFETLPLAPCPGTRRATSRAPISRAPSDVGAGPLR